MGIPTPSQLGRVAACITSEALPHAQHTNEAARGGIVFHQYMHDVRKMGRDAALLEIEDDDDRAAMEAVDMDRLGQLDPAAFASEVAIAWNVATGEARELGRGITREEAAALARRDEMVGILDLVGLTDDAVVVLDYKRGFGRVARAEVNWQTRTYALMAALCYHRTKAIQGVIRAPEGLTPWWDVAEMDSLDVDAHAADVRELLMKVGLVRAAESDQRPQLVEGAHCRYCPARPFCPAKAYLLSVAMHDPKELESATTEALASPERLARAWSRIRDAKALLDRLEAIVKDAARQQPIDLGDGWILGERVESKESVVADRARAVLMSLYGQAGAAVHGAAVKTETSLTKADLKRTLAKLVFPDMVKANPKMKKTHLERTVFDELRKAGAVSVSSYRKVDEHKPKPLEEPPAPEQQPPEAEAVTA